MKTNWIKHTAVMVFMLLSSGCSTESKTMTIEHAREGDVLFETDVETEDEIGLGWVHSVEKTPWTDIFTVKEALCPLMLTETRFQSFGAGVEHEYEEIEHSDGIYTAKGLDECHESINWIHSHEARHEITINGQSVVASESLPHHEPLRILIEER
jgi:hypothetical protein